MYHLNELYYSLAVLVILLAGLRWLMRRYSANVVMRTFVKRVATNHLPHIYHAQEQHTIALNKLLTHSGIDYQIELLPHPEIEFVDVENDKS